MTKEELMKTLHLTSEEADELIAYDLDVEKGLPSEYDLDEEHAKVAKEAMNMVPHKMSAKSRENQKTAQKVSIINALADFLSESDTVFADNVEIVDQEKLISFEIEDSCYDLKLTLKRK